MTPDQTLIDAARRILRGAADPQTRRTRAPDGRAAAWRALDDAGLTRAWLSESDGGAGASMVDGFAILTLAGEFALDVPLAETLLAAWLLARAGLPVPEGTLAPATSDHDPIGLDAEGRLRGQATAVPFAREVGQLVVIGRRGGPRDGDLFVALVDRAACTIEPRDNLAGEPRDTVLIDDAVPAALVDAPAGLADRLVMMGAVARACQMAGALQSLLARSVAHVGERVAFDRPIGKFQVIQHALARLAGEAAVALSASGSAADALASDTSDAELTLEVASAKIRVGEAAAAGAAIAHQVHGAIGFSTEHPLHLFTQRLWAWRDDFGSERWWALRLGARVAAAGADGLWPLLAAR